MKKINFFIEGLEISLMEDSAIVEGIKYNFLRNKFNCLEIPISKKKSIIIQPKCKSDKVNGFSALPDMIELVHYNRKREVVFAEIILQKAS